MVLLDSRRLLTILAAMTFVFAASDALASLAGRYVLDSNDGSLRLTLLDGKESRLSGNLIGEGIHLELSGMNRSEVGTGTAVRKEGSPLHFRAQLLDGKLELRLSETDEKGKPIASLSEVLMFRRLPTKPIAR